MSKVQKRQCEKCPWKVTTDPTEIPNGYSEDRHRDLVGTIAEPGRLVVGTLRVMACHESPVGDERICAGWVMHQLGPGNNLALRMQAMTGQLDVAGVELVGEQHDRFEDTLPRSTKRRAARRNRRTK